MSDEPSSSVAQLTFEDELSAAPLLQGWVLADHGHGRMHGWFFGHPEIEEGSHGNTSVVVTIDAEIPPRWARTESRLYRLGNTYSPAEREIRYWAQKHSGSPAVVGQSIGGSDDIEFMLTCLRSTGRIRAAKIDGLERAYFDERYSASTLDNSSD